jgi:dTDP-4-dehydrorhamnose 3,5-epimerase-like enzyme
MTANIQTLEFPILGDDRGKLIALEALSERIPFDVKRVYYIFDTTWGTVRGKHAHKKLKQILICVSGACTISCELFDGTKTEYRLDCPTKGLLIEGMVWHEMKDFSKDAVLLVLASEHYNEADYIRDYGEFSLLKASKNK